MTSHFPVYRIDATSAYERGLQYGQFARTRIAVSLETYRHVFRHFVGLDWHQATKQSEGYLEAITRFDSELVEEMRGLAEGSGNSFSDILALNSRSELMFTARLVDGCTAFASFGRAARDDATVLAQNWDWRSTQREAMVVLLIERLGKPSITMVTEAGMIGKFGFNSAGLGVCLNALVGERALPAGTPLHIVLRTVLEARTLSDAIEVVARANTACAANLLVAQHGNGAVDIEIVPGDFDVLLPHSDTIVHTNHVLSPRLATSIRDLGVFAFPDSYPRLARVRRLVEEHFGQLDVSAAQEILRDHANEPDSICRHEDEVTDPEEKRLMSVFSIVMDLEEQTMLLTDGPPCASAYTSPLHTLVAT